MLEQGTYNYIENISDNFESNLVMTDGLYPIVVGPENITIANSLGTLPADFAYRLNAYFGTPDNELKYIKLNNWSHVHDDPHSVPTNEKPVWTLTSNGILTSGITSGTISLFYFKHPTFAVSENTGEWVNLPIQEQYKIIKWAFKLGTTAMGDGDKHQFSIEQIKEKLL